MAVRIDLDLLTPVADIRGEDDEETASLKAMLSNAERYLSSFRWCPPIIEEYVGFGVGGVVALFLFRVQKRVNDTDEWLWVVEGDLPSAYFVVDNAPTPQAAMSAYCDLMEQWGKAVLAKSSLDEVFPVKAEPNQENATMLLSRIEFIREKLIPEIE